MSLRLLMARFPILLSELSADRSLSLLSSPLSGLTPNLSPNLRPGPLLSPLSKQLSC